MGIKLSSVKADIEREAKGDWVEYPEWPGVAFNVSSLHQPAYQAARDLLAQRYARTYKGDPVPPEVLARDTAELYGGHILHGWRGRVEDDGSPAEYSPDRARDMLASPAYRSVVTAVEWCAKKLSEVRVQFVVAAKKKLRANLRWQLTGQGDADWLSKLLRSGEVEAGDAAAIVVSDAPEDAQHEDWHDLYWRAWAALRHDRTYGAFGGETPVSYLAVSRYARDHGIAGEDLGIFRELFGAVDAEWLLYVAEKLEQQKEKSKT